MQYMHIYVFAKLWKLESRMTLSWRENFELQKAYFVNTNIWLFVNDAKWWCWWNFYDRSIAHVCRHILQWVKTKHILYHNWMHSKNFKVNFKINSHNKFKMYLKHNSNKRSTKQCTKTSVNFLSQYSRCLKLISLSAYIFLYLGFELNSLSKKKTFQLKFDVKCSILSKTSNLKRRLKFRFHLHWTKNCS